MDEVVQSFAASSSSSTGHGQSGSKACKDGCESCSDEERSEVLNRVKSVTNGD
jgi:hypothetical protein